MKNLRNLGILVVMLIVVVFSGLAYAITADEIIDKMNQAAPDFTTQKAISKMILIDKDGKVEEERSMLMFSKKEGDETTSLMRFLSPKSVKGVTLLNIKGGEKIYLYMPAYRKPRRIAGSSKSESFMGSDLSYEDLSMDYKDKKKYESKLVKETDTEYILEVHSLDKDTSYDKIMLFVDKTHFYAKKVELYKKGELSKIIQMLNVKIDDNGKVTPMEIVVEDAKTGHKTKMVMESIEYNIKLPSNFFSIRTLKKPKLQ